MRDCFEVVLSVLKMFECCFEVVLSVVLRLFEGSFEVVQGCFEVVLKLFEGLF